MIYIDAGHGAETPGKRSPDGRFLEWKQNRIIARALVEDLNARGIPAIMPIETDSDTPLSERTIRFRKLARRDDIIISIHHNAAAGKWWSNAHGTVVFIARNSPHETAAKTLLNTMCAVTGLSSRRGVKRSNFVPIAGMQCLAFLIEVGFMTNKAEVDRMLEPDFPALAARGIADGIEEVTR